MIHPDAVIIRARAMARFPLTDLGIYNCRKIAGTNRWSKHAWGEAWDGGVGGSLTLQLRVVRWLRTQPEVKRIVWRSKGHYRHHVHVEVGPNRTGQTPPCAEEEEEDVEKVVKGIQQSLADAGYDPGPIDGLMGPKTQAAMTQRNMDVNNHHHDVPAVKTSLPKR